MLNRTKQHIFFVDDDFGVRAMVHEALEGATFRVTSFSNASDCLEKLRSQSCDLLIADVEMPGMDGIALLTAVKEACPWIPIVLVTDDGDVRMAATAFKKGAADFLRKPLTKEDLLSAVMFALENVPPGCPFCRKPLTTAEAQVLRLLLEGKTNKEIARVRQRSRRTIEDQRRRIMHKLGAQNTVDLVKRGILMGLLGPGGNGFSE